MTVIFVCTGNTCRSPLAEGLARKLAAERGLSDVTFTSAGIGALTGAAASDGSMLVGIERGVDLSRHRARLFEPSLVDNHTIVLALSQSHVDAITSIVPNARVYLLSNYATRGALNESVRDPFGGELDEYRKTADSLETLLAGMLDRIATEQSSTRS